MKIPLQILFFLFFFVAPQCFGTLADLTHRGVRDKIHEILQIHVRHNKIDEPLVKKILETFLEEIDPLKNYFTKEDISYLLDPKDSLLQKAVMDFRYANYPLFYEVQKKFIAAIERRRLLEEELDEIPLLTTLPKVDWSKIDWAANEKELKNRLLLARSYCEEFFQSMDENTKCVYQKIRKNRQKIREEKALSKEKKKQENWILTHVLKSFCASLDSNTSYFTPIEALQFMTQLQRTVFGIGAQLKEDILDGFRIVHIIEKGPADLSKKLKVEDRIIEVDNEPVVGLTIFEAVEKIRGPKGTTVNLTILREKKGDQAHFEKIQVEIMRDEVILEEGRLSTKVKPFGNGNILHIKLFSFYQDAKYSSSKDIQKELENAQKNYDIQGVILDLRGNAGGLLEEAIKVTGLFMDNGVVVSIKDNQGRIHHGRVQSGKACFNGPLIILTNKLSASASEIVAGCLQDYGKALIVGDPRTYGKGTFQTATLNPSSGGKINPAGEFRITRGIYYTVSGNSPQLVGVLPDIIVPGALQEMPIGECFSKFPIENDAIAPKFEDDLADIPLWQRRKFGEDYRAQLQKISTFYVDYKEILAKNSATRIQNNEHYQQFLKEVQKDLCPAAVLSIFHKSDPQLEECFYIMQDLLFLMACNKIAS